jgi:hypothetical protein
MYSLVRLNGIISIAFGLVVLSLGIAVAIFGVTNNMELVKLANIYIMAGSGYRLLDIRFYTSTVGVFLFLIGLGISSRGQLLISLANTSANTNEVVRLLKELVTSDKPTVINHVNVNTEETKNQDQPVVISTENQ